MVYRLVAGGMSPCKVRIRVLCTKYDRHTVLSSVAYFRSVLQVCEIYRSLALVGNCLGCPSVQVPRLKEIMASSHHRAVKQTMAREPPSVPQGLPCVPFLGTTIQGYEQEMQTAGQWCSELNELAVKCDDPEEGL